MNLAIVAPAPSPAVRGGTERAVDGLKRAFDEQAGVEATVVKLAVDESNLAALVDAYERFAHLDLSAYDRVLSVKYPAWMVAHPNHSVYLFHPLRGLYDTYHLFGLPRRANPQSAQAKRLCDFIARVESRDALWEFFGRFSELRQSVPADSPDLAFPGPIARDIVHWLDRIAMSPSRIRRYFALSRTVAGRADYFPAGVIPEVVTLPGDLTPCEVTNEPGRHLFTASRLDGPKRLELLIDAMAHVTPDVPLKIAGTGPEEQALRQRAAHDSRIEFCGFVPDDQLVGLYRDAIAVPFVPWDEDLGLISVEAGSQCTPVVTCIDSGGPTEFVANGVNGLIAQPTPHALGTALDRVASDPQWARRMGIAAHRKAASITWADTARRLLELPSRYRSTLLGDHDGPHAPARTRHTRRAKVVSLATYGIADPAHGGQLRVHHLCRSLSRSIDVHQVALDANATATRHVEIAPGLECTIVPRSHSQIDIENVLGLKAGQPVTDIMSGIDAHLTPEFVSIVAELTRSANLVVLEQPFLFPVLEKANVTVPFVVNTQNVEWDLRDATLEKSTIRATLLDAVGQIEALALTSASSVTACSDEDATRFGSLYAVDPALVHLVPNGTLVPGSVESFAARQRAGELWLHRFNWNRAGATPRHLGVFFGSWHPPNIDAAEFLVELATERPDLLIVSAGHHGLAFTGRDLPENIVFPGPVSDREKDALLRAATVALNPMRTGSGTNLKIIEFLALGVPTVSTKFGARGLDLEDETHVLLAEPEQFGAAIDRIIDDRFATEQRIIAAHRRIASYDWDAIGARYRDLIEGIIAA